MALSQPDPVVARFMHVKSPVEDVPLVCFKKLSGTRYCVWKTHGAQYLLFVAK